MLLKGITTTWLWLQKAITVVAPSDITVSEGAGAPAQCGTDNTGMAICCNISSDDNGDGIGEQSGGEVCVVTSDTRGWHPANPDNILAAINVGATGDALQVDGIWYDSNLYVNNGSPNGTQSNSLYDTEAYGDGMTIKVPMSNQEVSVELGFAELYHEASGERSFDVSIEGSTVVKC